MENIKYGEYKYNRTRSESVFIHTKTPSETIQGNVTAMRYWNDVIMSDLLLHIRANLGMKLARDYASCHVARSTLVMLVSNTYKNLRLPAKSIDLNPYIDNLMDLFSFLFSVRLLSVLRGHLVISSPPPTSKDFLSQILSIKFIFYLNSWERVSISLFQC